MITKEEIKMAQDATAREGRVEGDHVVVPGDFFERLNAKLNEGKPPFMEALMQELLRDDSSAATSQDGLGKTEVENESG